MSEQDESRTKRVGKAFFNPSLWFGYQQAKDTTAYLKTTILKFFVPRQSARHESFEQALARLELSQKDIEARMKVFFRLTLLMLVLAALVLVYTAYLIAQGHYHSGLLSGVVCLLALGMSFRYHFWYFQLRNRKLGCSLREWFKTGVLGAKK